MAKTILITGGTGKVGKQLVYHFEKQGFNVVFISRDDNKIKEIEKNSKNIIGLKLDLLGKNFISDLLKALQERNIKIDYLINNARCLDYLTVEKDGSIKRENWVNEYLLDVVIPYELSMNLEKNMPLKKIVNIASIYGVVTFNPNLYEGDFNPLMQYSCAKAALIHLTKELAVKFADKNIQVNSIAFGGIEGRVDDSFKERYSKLCPEKRMMKEEDVIGSVDFLISDNSTYMNGQNIVVDGGWSVW